MFILIQALVTAILSGLFSGAVIFALNERRDRENMLLRKTDEAVEAFIEWSTCMEAYPAAHMKLFVPGKFTEAYDRLEQIWAQSYAASNKARALVAIYLPQQQRVIAQYAQSYLPFMTLSAEARGLAVAGKPSPEGFLEAVNEAGSTIVKAGGIAVGELAAAGRARAHAPFLVQWPRRQGRA